MVFPLIYNSNRSYSMNNDNKYTKKSKIIL